MPLSTWTERDELLSDALHMRDVALGLDRPLVDEPEHEPLTAVELAMEQRLRTATWGVVDAYREERKLNAKPALTSDDRPSASDATNNAAVIATQWVDGRAAFHMVEAMQAADAILQVEPRSVETDLIVEPCREVGGVEPAPTRWDERGETFSVPTPDAAATYVAIALGGRNGSRPNVIRIEGLGEFQRRVLVQRPAFQQAYRVQQAASFEARVKRSAKVQLRNLAPLRGRALRSAHDLVSHGCADLALTARRDRLVTDHPLPLPSSLGAEFGVPVFRILAGLRKYAVLTGQANIGTHPARDMRSIAQLWARVDRFHTVHEATQAGAFTLSDEHFAIGQDLTVELVNQLAA